MSKLIISLTTIPPRMKLITPTLRDLLAQSAEVAEVRLNISRSYRRFDFDEADIPAYPSGVKVCLVDEDYGPATKVLPTARAFANEDVEILFCDDDQHYPVGWAQQFLDARRERPDACIAETGFQFYDRADTPAPAGVEALEPRAQLRKKDLRYRLYRMATLGRRRPSTFGTAGYLDGFKGYRGAMIRPEFLPAAAFDIPDIMWTHDDVWLSGQMAANGIGIWGFVSDEAWRPPYGAERVNALLDWTYKDHGRQEAHNLLLDYFQKEHGLWLSGRAV